MYTPPWDLPLCLNKHNAKDIDYRQDEFNTASIFEGITSYKFQHNAEGYTVFIDNFFTGTY